MFETLSPMSPATLTALTSALQPARRAWTQAAAQTLESFGLSMSLASAVILVSRHEGGMRQTNLAEEIGVNQGAMVRTLDQAEQAGLLERRAVAGDRRANSIHILPEGARLAAQMEASLSRLRIDLLGDLSAADAEAALSILRQIDERCSIFARQGSEGK